MYKTQISIYSVISISLTLKIFDIKLVRGRCQDIALASKYYFIRNSYFHSRNGPTVDNGLEGEKFAESTVQGKLYK